MFLSRKYNGLNSMVSSSLWDLPTPSSMSYFWNFGSLLGVCFIIQVTTGLFLSFHYISFADLSFSSLIHISRDVWLGWMVRFLHMNGASLFFIFIYFHIARGLFFQSSVSKMVWVSGVTILLLLMAVSFLGYVLPWGQMSYWAVAVITNLFSVVPLVGVDIVNWIWGGFSVGVPTLTRFYSLHFLLPFFMAFFILVHLYFLHINGSSMNLGLNGNVDKFVFHPYFSLKDFFSWILLFGLFMFIVFFSPYLFGDPVNFVPADPMSTPTHIQPEWYFLFSYAILRSFPGKVAGVVALFSSVLIYYVFPFFTYYYSSKFSFIRYFLFWVLISSFFFLMYIGSMPAEYPYIWGGQVFTFIYFLTCVIINI
ncbi:cytochrome b (mitochondrion) [Fragariocoptes setiger]|uniref:Cytochrome b n=1 Tax=Fragariocoptes setiger TaxID=1670756 RepID=A0ABQ7SDE4_9ACAR|nr:cytochrome b [Fragariocoptes setiger]